MNASNIWTSTTSAAHAPSMRRQHREPNEVTTLPVNVTIGYVSGNSGVYIGGKLTVFGLSAHSKSNSGFGDIGDSNVLYQCVSYVNDPDVVDTPIDDRDVHVVRPTPSENDASLTNIGVGTVWVNTMQQNAGTFIGSTNISGMDSHEKQNLGSGQVFGNQNLNCQSLNLTNDRDVIDGIIRDDDNKAGVFFNG